MKRLIVAGIWISPCVSLMELSAALAQARTAAVTQCLYSILQDRIGVVNTGPSLLRSSRPAR